MHFCFFTINFPRKWAWPFHLSKLEWAFSPTQICFVPSITEIGPGVLINAFSLFHNYDASPFQKGQVSSFEQN